MFKVFIDANIFLGLYDSKLETTEIFDDLNKIASSLVMTDQLSDEFLRNREKKISDLEKILNKGFSYEDFIRKIQKVPVPDVAIIHSFKNFDNISICNNKITGLKDSYEKIIKEQSKNFKKLSEEILDLLEKPENDIVYINFKKLFNDDKVQKLKKNDEIINKAYYRKLIGNPPRSDIKTIGDEIHWEILLENIKTDLIIISRDETFTANKSFLIEEFYKKTNKKLYIDKKISFALEKIGKRASNKTIEFEDNYIKKDQKLSETLEALSKSYTTSFNPAVFEALSKSCTISLNPEVLEALNRPLVGTLTPAVLGALSESCTISLNPEVLEVLNRPLIASYNLEALKALDEEDESLDYNKDDKSNSK